MGFLWSQLFITPPYPTTSFAGKTVIVTGANTGLGKATACHIARLGASKLILAVRNLSAGERAKKDIESTTKCSTSVIEVWSLDLCSYESVRAFATRASTLPRLDVLLENAGIGTPTWSLAEGHERTITVNVISTFLLALLLLPKLKATAKDLGSKTHLTIVSSETHAWTKFPEWKEPNTFDALDRELASVPDDRYYVSKLLEVLVVRAISPKLTDLGVILNLLNPGLCHSDILRESNMIATILKFFFARSTEVGGRTLVAGAVAGPESHGNYMTDSKVNFNALSPFVRSDDGKAAAEKIWGELRVILEAVSLGVTQVVQH